MINNISLPVVKLSVPCLVELCEGDLDLGGGQIAAEFGEFGLENVMSGKTLEC